MSPAAEPRFHSSRLDQWRNLSDRELEAVYLTACAEDIQWLIDGFLFERDRLVIRGWALAISGLPEQARFLINGRPFEDVQYPISSPDVGEFFWNIPAAQAARFVCKTAVDWEHSFPDGFACFEFLTEGCDPAQSRRRAWYLPTPKDDLPIPDEARTRRIGVPDAGNYLIGGAAIYKRVEDYLEQTFSKSFADFPSVLDWGCGCGRVARHFRWAKGTKLNGVDIDADSIAWCRESLPHAQFERTSLEPPIHFPDDSFDLILGIAAFSQLTEERQLAWMRELKRIARKDAIVMVSIQGLPQLGLNRPHPRLLLEIEERGFVVAGRNNEIDAVVSDPDYYVSVLHSRDYIYEIWGKHFSIVDIVSAMAANQDLVVMKNDKPDSLDFLPGAPPRSTSHSENPFSLPLRDYDINPYIHPAIAKSGYAGHLVDIDDKDYIDFLSGWGTNLLGYGYRKVARAVARQAKRFNCLGLPFPQFLELMDLIRRIVPSAEEVRYGKNGSDACAGAIRLARYITGREKILYRGYHGFHDWYFASTDCPGIPTALRPTVIAQPDLSPSAVDLAFRQHRGEIAALILNPLTGPIPNSDEISEVIEVIHHHGGLVIFDEMLSGFRVAPGGMQELWSVKPDLSGFGKAIANGLPLSVLCGKGEYMRRLPETYYGMTFEGEAVSIAAAFATLTEVIEKKVVAALYDKGRKIRSDYQRLANIHNLSTSLVGFEPTMHMDFQTHGNVPGRELLLLMIQELVRCGVLTCGAFVLCFSHSRRDLRRLEKALDSAMTVVRQAVDRGTTQGLLDERIRLGMEHVKGPATWRRAGQKT